MDEEQKAQLEHNKSFFSDLSSAIDAIQQKSKLHNPDFSDSLSHQSKKIQASKHRNTDLSFGSTS